MSCKPVAMQQACRWARTVPVVMSDIGRMLLLAQWAPRCNWHGLSEVSKRSLSYTPGMTAPMHVLFMLAEVYRV